MAKFSEASWIKLGTNQKNYIATEKAWLFSLTSKEKYKLKSANSQYAGYGSASYGPTFGGGNNDLYLSGDFRTLSNGGSPLSYECSDTSKFMGGTTFQVKEIEVYQAVFEKQGKENTVEDKKSKNSKSASKILSSEQFGNVIDYVGENVGVDSVERIYQATKDGFSAADFHKKCDGKSNFLVVAKSGDGFAFGGYTKSTFTSEDSWANDSSAFVFRFDESGEAKKYTVSEESTAVYYNSNALVQFGDGPDLKIGTNANTNVTSLSYLGTIYTGSDGACTVNGGTNEFILSEIEIFKIKTADD